jgi:hypothetical protein
VHERVQRGGFREQPAGKHRLWRGLALALKQERTFDHLQEGGGLEAFMGLGPLAAAQDAGNTIEAEPLARFQGEFASGAQTLVEHADDGGAFGRRRGPPGRGRRLLGRGSLLWRRNLLCGLGGKRGGQQQAR